ncbi:hypothetical protein AMS68_000248 [Peltaster fructicola]|uniref:Carboxylic ester hydrolase n=1 Tax=Peltaster fructicola TaxID=286661 RepID=A0A6H0XJB3_9PEZI|nr:hypothetical protein AMS68_000248 [Peltaster fructicola]
MAPLLHAMLLGSTFLVSATYTASLADLCTVDNVQAALPADQEINGISFVSSITAANAVYNASLAGAGMGASTASTTTYSYCNITAQYTHTNKNDTVVVKYALPDPSSFASRFYTAGGGGYALSSSTTGGLPYGAASGATSAGYNAFSTDYDVAVLYGNGSINWDATHAFGYEALGEMTSIGKILTKNFYNTSGKIYTYFQGCSDGGRQGMSQVQRWGDLYDGVVAGAPAFRYAHQQVNHVFSSFVEYEQDYFPPPCALTKIVTETIKACDSLDGRTDGVVARSDLCQLNFDLSSLVGTSYYCAATTSSSLGFGFSNGGMRRRQMGGGSTTSSTPEQNGTITAQDIAVAQAIYDGLHNSNGERAYLSWQIASELTDAATTYNNATGQYELSITSLGGEFVAKFVQLLDIDNLTSFEGVTADTLVEWMNIAFHRYYDTLQTTFPDLTAFKANGGKLLHYHGESDSSVPAASSVHYWQSVRSIMSSGDCDDSDLSDWYQLYLIPGAAHCGSNTLQPGPYPTATQLMDTIIEWVENGSKPEHLNATVSSGTYANETQQLCQWPNRPLWASNSSSTFSCVYDQDSDDSWTYTFPAFKLPVY